jgi:tricarballylate dehydrogenase
MQGIAIPKANWANTLDTPPFKACSVTCGITFTFGGMRITGGTSLTNGAVFSKIAGTSTAS